MELKKYIDSFVIVDTGSTDSTMEEINRFRITQKVPGEVFQHRFQDQYFDFSKNRTYALEKCYGKSDYIFVFDADDVIEGVLPLPSHFGNHDVYRIKIKSSVYYYRPLIFRNDPKYEFHYVCPIHEYLESKVPIKTYTISEGNYNVISRRLGDRNRNPNKYQNDALVLEQSIRETLESAPHYPRLVFYCAQSHRAANNTIRAKELYWKRYNMKNTWVQERYFSLFGIFLLNKDSNVAHQVYELAEDLFTNREEIRYKYFTEYNPSKEIIINSFTKRIPKLDINTNDILFHHKDLHEKMFEYYNRYISREVYYKLQSINKTQNYSLEKNIIYDKVIEEIYNNDDLDLLESISDSNNDLEISLLICDLLYSRKDYTKGYNRVCKLLDKYGRKFKDFSRAEKVRDQYVDRILKFTRKDHKYAHQYPEDKNLPKVLVSLTCCKRYDLMKPTLNSFFNCCTDVNLVSKFLCIDDNSSEEDRKKMKVDFPMFEYVFKNQDQKGHSVSMNMIYDFAVENNFDYVFHMEDDWQFVQELPYISRCIQVLNSNESYIQCIPNRNNAEIPDYQRPIGRGLYIENPPHVLHEHFDNPSLNLQMRSEEFKKCSNISYWGSFTFHTGMWKMSNVKILGNFSTDGFFERDYALDALNAGFKLTFLDTFSYYNIGRKSWEPRTNHNAYTANNTSQFDSSKNDLIIYVKTSNDYLDSNWVSFKKTNYKTLKFRGHYGSEEQFLDMNIGTRVLISSHLHVNDQLINFIRKQIYLPGIKYQISRSDIIVCNGKYNSKKESKILNYGNHIIYKIEDIRNYDIIPGFKFIPYQDIQGEDIVKESTLINDDSPQNLKIWKKWLDQLVESCNRYNGNAFNTFGYIKKIRASSKPEINKWFHRGFHGIYVKI